MENDEQIVAAAAVHRLWRRALHICALWAAVVKPGCAEPI
jgi:hypothetical protein